MTAADEVRSHAEQVRGGRFPFGDNWRRFLSAIDDDRIAEAERSLREWLDADSLAGKSFLDVGSGSGLFSLAARRLGATVVSFDNDPQSVMCTAELRQRYFPRDPHWRVVHGSVLDTDFLKSLGRFDVVYAWGVLHHTGQMWQACEDVKINTAAGGRLFIAIYNDCGQVSLTWLERKKRYNRLPRALRLPYTLWVWTPLEVFRFVRYGLKGNLRGYFDLWRHYKRNRGMSRWHDMIDWLGGYPYEFASADELVTFFERADFHVTKLLRNEGSGCHQVVFERV